MSDNDPMPQDGKSQPEIPSFKQAQGEQEKKGGGFNWFGRGGGGPKPLLRVRGLGGTSIIERLKQFRKKDLAFIASGIGVLLLAPLAEHYILGPGEEQKTLTQGFDQKGNAFSDAAGNMYEPGAGGFAPGGLPGQGNDVITPLNVRDPAALVMGPGATQQPPAAAQPTTPAKESKEDWKEALSNAGRSAARAAEPAPFSKGTLAGSIRGLSALSGSSGGGGPSYTLPAPSAAGVPNKTGGGSSLTRVQAAPGFQGAAGGRSNTQGSGGADALRKAAEQAANQFNRAGGAAGALQAAAGQSIPGGGSSDNVGGPGGGAENKNPGGNSTKDNKSLGESLAFIRAKMEMEKALELKWKKIEWNQFEKQKMMQETIIKDSLDAILKDGILKPVSGAISGLFPTNDNKPVLCAAQDSDGMVFFHFKNADAKKDCETGAKDSGNPAECDRYRKWNNDHPHNLAQCDKNGKPDSAGGGGRGDGTALNMAGMDPVDNGKKLSVAIRDFVSKSCSNLSSPICKALSDLADLNDKMEKLAPQEDTANTNIENAKGILHDALPKLRASVTDLASAKGALKEIYNSGLQAANNPASAQGPIATAQQKYGAAAGDGTSKPMPDPQNQGLSVQCVNGGSINKACMEMLDGGGNIRVVLGPKGPLDTADSVLKPVEQELPNDRQVLEGEGIGKVIEGDHSQTGPTALAFYTNTHQRVYDVLNSRAVDLRGKLTVVKGAADKADQARGAIQSVVAGGNDQSSPGMANLVQPESQSQDETPQYGFHFIAHFNVADQSPDHLKNLQIAVDKNHTAKYVAESQQGDALGVGQADSSVKIAEDAAQKAGIVSAPAVQTVQNPAN